MAKKTKKEIELDRYLCPHAVCRGTAVTRDIVEIIKKWAAGEISWYKTSDKHTLAEAEKALASGAKWFAVTYVKDSHVRVKTLTPVTSVAEAKKLGFEPYEVPGFPKLYDPEEKVGEQQFTYGQLYAAWRGAFEEMIADSNYPFFADLRAHPDYSWCESIECSCDDISAIFEQASEFSREIDAMCVDFYYNDPWTGQADSGDYGFHVENGEIDSGIKEEYLPATQKEYRITFRSEIRVKAASAEEAEEKFGEIDLYSEEAKQHGIGWVETNSVEEV
jgi:hypothetical protein